MGWSCGAAAGSVMDEWSKSCAIQTGSSNIWKAGESYYMFEPSRIEHNDGAITGSIHKFIGNPIGAPSCMAKRSGGFRIEGNGEVSRGPKLLKAAADVWKKEEAAKPKVPLFLASWPKDYLD
jgi:hypothetical protein